MPSVLYVPSVWVKVRLGLTLTLTLTEGTWARAFNKLKFQLCIDSKFSLFHNLIYNSYASTGYTGA